MTNEVTTEVELLADGGPVLAALESVRLKIGKIQESIAKVMDTADSGAKKFDAKLAQQVKSLQAALGQMQTLAKFAETGGQGKGPITKLNQERSLGRATIAASQFAKVLKNAESSAEGLATRITAIERKAAGLGSIGALQSRSDERATNALKAQLAELKKLDAERDKLNAKAERTLRQVKGSSFTGNTGRITNAQDALYEKIRDGRSTPATIAPALAELRNAQTAYAESIELTRKRKVDTLAVERANTAEIRNKAKAENDYERALAEVATKQKATSREVADDYKRTLAERNALEKKGEEQVAAAQLRILERDKLRRAEAKALLADVEAAEAKTRLYDVKFNKSLIPNQTTAAIAGGNGEALRLDLEQRILQARERYLLVGAKDKQQAFEVLEIEKLRLLELNKQLRAKERETASGKSPSILPAGGLGTVLARTAAYAAAGSGIFAIVGALHAGASAAIELEDSLGKLQAIAGATDGQMVKLTESIINVGKTSRFSLAQLADAATILAQAGVSTTGIESSLQAVSTLAAASGSTLAQSVDVVTSTLAAFNLQASESGRISDAYTAALNRSKLTIGDIAAAVGTAGATAAESNLSFQELTGAIGAMTQAGVRGTRAATGLRQLLIDFIDPNKKLSEVLTGLGVTFEDIDVRTRGLPAVLETLGSKGFGAAEAFKGLENRSAAAYLTLKRQIPLMQELTIAQNDSGVAAAAAAKSTNTLAAQWQILKNTAVTGSFNLMEMFHIKEAVAGINQIGERVAYIAAYNKSHGTYDSGGTGDPAAISYAQYKAGADGMAEYNKKLDEAATKTKNATEAFDTQNQRVNSVDEAIHRLVMRHRDLQDNSAALAVETSNMSHQFEGLSAHLDLTSNSFSNLLNAAKAYRVEQLKILEDDASTAALQAKNQFTVTNGGVAGSVRHIREIQNQNHQQLAPDIQELITRALNPGHDSFQTMGTVIDKLRDRGDGIKGNDPLRQAILDLTVQLRGLRGIERTGARMTAQGDTLRLAQRGDYTALQNEINGLTNNSKDRPEVSRLIAGILKILKRPGLSSAARELNNKELEQLQALLSSPGSLYEKPEKEMSLSKENALGNVVTTIRNAFGQNSVTSTNKGKHVKGSDHYNDQAVDFVPEGGMGEYSYDEMFAELTRRGVHIRRNKNGTLQLFGPGHGPKGPGDHSHDNHWHVGFTGSASPEGFERRSEAVDLSNEQLGLKNADRDLKKELGDVSKATSVGVYDSQVELARKAFKVWETEFTDLTNKEIAHSHMSPGQKKLRLSEMKDTIDAKRDDLESKVSDGLIKYLENAFKAAAIAFELAMVPAEAKLAKLQAQVTGLDEYAKVDGNVPDYVRSLAQNRVDRAGHERDVAELSNKNVEINSTSGALNAGRASLLSSKAGTAEYETYSLKVDNLTKSLDSLIKTRDALAQKLGAGGLIPKTFSQGLREAAQAIRETAGFGATFKETLITNVGGALNQVSTSLDGFFNDLFTGSQTALGAFAGFAKGIAQMLEQLAAKFLASQIFGLLLSLIPTGGGLGAGLDGINQVSDSLFKPAVIGAYTGGLIGYSGGGEVMNGSSSRDSVVAKLAKGEFVVQKASADAVGSSFLNKLNSHGVGAFRDLQSAPTIVGMGAKQEMRVFVVAPDHKPSMSPQDVLLIVSDDMLKNGVTKQLVRSISQGN
jgi:TP901 family phage tail tape measure protein